MNINPEQFPTYKSLSPVLRNQTTCDTSLSRRDHILFYR